MAFADFPQFERPVALLQRSLERGRLGHAYLFTGARMEQLEPVARTLAKAVNCDNPPRRSSGGLALDCCDRCPVCRQVDQASHPDVHWLRPESKLRVIRVEPLRELLHEIHLKPTQAGCKLAIICGADRFNEAAANAFLKTLEEPPPRSLFVLLSTDAQRVLETVLSRCLRLAFGGVEGQTQREPEANRVRSLVGSMSGTERGLLPRYRVLDRLVRELGSMRARIAEALEQDSPLNRYTDAAPEMRERWEDELSAGIEAEYRRQRTDLLSGIQWWLRDVWLLRLGAQSELLGFPDLREDSRTVADRITSEDALQNLETIERTQRLLATNVQEALALEICLMRLRL